MLLATAASLAHAESRDAHTSHDRPAIVRGIDGRLAVYAFSNTSSEVVAWLSANTTLKVKGALTDNQWLCVEPTDSMNVWVYRELIRDNRIHADKSQIRAGIGMNSRPVARLNKGMSVEVRGTYGEWLKIKPPDGVVFWVLREQVEPVADNFQLDVEEYPFPNTGLVSVDQITRGTLDLDTAALRDTNALTIKVTGETCAPPTPVLRGLAADDMAVVQGRSATFTGLLDWGSVGMSAFPYCITRIKENGESTPICHLSGSVEISDDLIGTTVTVEGTCWFTKESPLPVLVPHVISSGLRPPLPVVR